MHEQMLEQVAEERGYDRGFTAGTRHAHDLLNQYLDSLKYKRGVIEEDGRYSPESMDLLRARIDSVERAKLIIRTGHFDNQTVQ